MTTKYIIFKKHGNKSNMSNVHNVMLNRITDNYYKFVPLISQEDEILKIAFYYDDTLNDLFCILYIKNIYKQNFSHKSANFINDRTKGFGVIFEDGIEHYSFIPEDTFIMGTSELNYKVRWKRIYNNYYLVTIFRPYIGFVREELMTEKDGKNLTPILGNSSAEKDSINIYGNSIGQTIWLQYKVYNNGKPTFLEATLVPVYEKDLPPDFPKGLIQWLP